MAEKSEILLEVKVDTAKVAQQMANATNQVRILKQEQKLLTKAFEEGTIADQDYAKAMAESKAELEKANREVKSTTALLQAETMARVDDTMSLDQQRQALNAAQKAYASLSGEEKEAADAQGGLRDQINALSDSVKKQEAALGDNRRNVGNYTESIKEAAAGMGGLGSGLVGVSQKMNQAKTMMSALYAHPIIALIAVIVLTLKKIGEAFKNNAAAMERLTGVFGAFSGVGTMVNKVIDKIAEGLGWIGEKALALADKLGLLSDEMKDGMNIAKEDLAIQKAQREAALQTAEDQKKIAELRAQAADENKYSASERIKLLKQANDLEEGISKRQYDLAKREYDLQVKKNQQSASSQEDLKKENDLKIKMIEAETAYFNKQKELNSQLSAARKQNAADAKAAADEQTKILEEAAAKLQDIRNKLLERSRSEVENRIADLEKAKDEELSIAGLTAEERLQIEQYYADQIKAVYEEEKQTKEQAERDKAKAHENALIELGLSPEKTDEEIALERAEEAYAQGVISYEEYEQAKAAIQQRFAMERQRVLEEQVKEAKKLYNEEAKDVAASAAGAMDALGELVGAFAEENEEAKKAQKAFAMGSIIINQAIAIAEGAKGIAAAMAGAAAAAAATGPAAPIMMAVYQAQMVGEVLSVITSVASTIAQAKQLFSQADTQKFAHGGIVEGTSYTGDKVPVMANSREMYLTLGQQKELFDIANGNGAHGINYELLAASVAALPAPIMEYTEFKQFEQNVSTYNEIAAV